MEEQVILVDRDDQEIGTIEKMEAHRTALLHRAFSVFIFNRKGDMLLQQRAVQKYHSGGLWTNACCSHPRPGESTEAAAQRRLLEEMGFSTNLKKGFDFIYRADLDNNLSEHELDHVFIGVYDGDITPNPVEVKDYCFKSVESIMESIELQPHKYTAWFLIAFSRVIEWANTEQKVAV